MTKLLAFAGSTRRESWNKKLVRCAAERAREAGATVTVIDLSDYPLPLYDGDLEAEQGPPDAASELLALFKAHDGLLLSCPEYNGSITAVLKNTLDWVSRPREGDPPLVAFKGKVAALLSASPGAYGGMRGLVHVRAILGNLGVLVLPAQVAVSRADQAFTPEGALLDAGLARRVDDLARELVETTSRLRAS